jgi:hypothetical protein
MDVRCLLSDVHEDGHCDSCVMDAGARQHHPD